MNSGKPLVIVSTLIIGLFVGAFVYLLGERNDLGPPVEFIEQMRANPNCTILAAGNSGVRRHALAALLQEFPDWGIPFESVSSSPGPIHVSGAGDLPPAEDGVSMSYVELAWPEAGPSKDLKQMKAIHILCRDNLAVAGTLITVPIIGETYHTKSMMMPGDRVVMPAASEPVIFEGQEHPDPSWRTRCWVDNVGKLFYTCQVDSLDSQSPGRFVPRLRYRKWAQNIGDDPTLVFDGHIEQVRRGEQGVSVRFAIDLKLEQLSDKCLESGSYSVADGRLTLQDDCETTLVEVAGTCDCGPMTEGVSLDSTASMTCSPGAEGRELALLCSRLPKTEGFDSVALSTLL